MMNAIQQRMRPKHQVLVLKCYPRINKGAVDVKPNSSELSYLLFYATSRRSKIQKIGAFLEKKTAGDVSHMRIGNVQVTLAILAALVEKSPKEAALIAPTVLKILRLILGSNDITMIESSIPTFEAFCENHDPSSLFGDKDYLNQYEAVIRTYAQLASKKHRAATTAASRSVQIRWRNVGLGAIKCVSAADALSSLSGRQIDVIIPVILENLWSDNENFLDVVSDRLETEEKLHADNSSRRKNSIATIRTNQEAAADTSPLAITGTATQVDNMAEEETGVLALQCLKSIFVVPNQSQIYSATMSLMRFITERVADSDEKVIVSDPSTGADSGPAIQILNIITRWAPVQDRYIILVVALDTMLGTALQENTLERHIVYAAMISSMLRSDLNLIGLSVMDVLHGLLRKMRKLLQLGSDSSSDKQVEDGPQNTKNLSHSLLTRLEGCVGDLATHVYYADQIWDMITAILIRLKPGLSSSTTSLSHAERVTTVQANGDGNHATTTEDLSTETSQNPQNDHSFSYTAGRLSALGAIKAVLLVANPQKKVSGNVELSRNRLPIQVWENTQWLLQDPDGNVRMAYVNVLLTWLDRETVSQDCNADDDDDDDVSDKFASCRYNHDGYGVHSRRAVSNASQREKKCKNNHISHFLSMLHLAIYDSALQLVDFDGDMCLLHALLSRLVAKLGINAVRFGLPMIFRLQEEIQEVEMPIQKVRIAALCHGYFLTVTDKFQLGKSNVGRVIGNEVARRRQTQFWVQGITVPPQPLQKIGPLGRAGEDPGWDVKAVETGELLPFDDRISLVESIASAYRSAIQSPPGSPTGSSRLSGPAGHGPSSMQATHQSKRDPKLPRRYRHQLLHEWSRESIKAAIAAQQKADSVAGSKTGTATTRGNRQKINNAAGAAANGTQNPVNGLPASSYDSLPNQRPKTAQTQGAGDRFGTHGKLRKSSIRSARGGSPSTGGHGHKAGGVVSVDQLKMMLSSNVSPRDAGIPAANVDDDNDDDDDEEDSAESMVSYDYTLSEVSFNPATTGAGAQDDNGSSSPTGTSGQEAVMKRNVSNSSRSGTPQQQRSLERGGGGAGLEAANNGAVVVEREASGGEGSNKMASPPPLPPLPSAGSLANLSSGKKQYVMQQEGSLKPPRNRSTSSGGNREGGGRAVSGSSSGGAGAGAGRGPGMDLQDLLRGIDSSCGQGSMGNVSRPPY